MVHLGHLKKSTKKFLRVDIELDETLSVKSHVHKLRSHLSAVAGKMFAARKVLPLHAKKTLYNSLFHSRLIYGCEGWGGTYKTTLESLQTVQNRMIKLIYGLPKLTPTRQLFSDPYFFSLPVRAQFDFRTAMMIFKMLKNLVNTNLHFDPVHYRYVGRRRSNINVPTYRLNYGSQRFSVRATKLWNELRNSLDSTPNTLFSFKKQLMKYMKDICDGYLD